MCSVEINNTFYRLPEPPAFEEGQSVFAYFNNDTGGHAPRDAVRLREKLQQALS